MMLQFSRVVPAMRSCSTAGPQQAQQAVRECGSTGCTGRMAARCTPRQHVQHRIGVRQQAAKARRSSYQPALCSSYQPARIVSQHCQHQEEGNMPLTRSIYDSANSGPSHTRNGSSNTNSSLRSGIQGGSMQMTKAPGKV